MLRFSFNRQIFMRYFENINWKLLTQIGKIFQCSGLLLKKENINFRGALREKNIFVEYFYGLCFSIIDVMEVLKVLVNATHFGPPTSPNSPTLRFQHNGYSLMRNLYVSKYVQIPAFTKTSIKSITYIDFYEFEFEWFY